MTKLQENKTDIIWHSWYAKLIEYVNTHGNPHVPRTYEADRKLANWVWTQRQRKDRDYSGAKKLTSKQVKLLNAIGFYWDPREEIWVTRFEELISFRGEFGHCNAELEPGYSKLHEWLKRQRVIKAEGRLDPEHQRLLESLGVDLNIVYKRDIEWNDKFAQLEHYLLRHGDIKVPSSINAGPDIHSLYVWMERQRRQRENNALTERQVKLLDSLRFNWTRTSKRWVPKT
jgi:hypothetical protein